MDAAVNVAAASFLCLREENMAALLKAFFTDPAGMALQLMLIVAFTDFALGVMAAYRDSTLQLNAIAAFLRKHIVGRVFPIGLMLIVGYVGNVPLFYAAGIAGAAAYTLETIGSILASWGPNRAVQPVPVD